MKQIFLLCCLCFLAGTALAQATWIWYPGDYEIWLSNRMQNRRTDRGAFFPVFWKMDSHYPLMDFHKDVMLSQAEEVHIYAEGTYNVKLDGQPFEGTPAVITVPAGRHRINVKVFSQGTVPAIYVKGATIVSDSSWLTTYEDKEWIDETGKTSDITATKWLHAGCWNFNDPATLPAAFTLPTQSMAAVNNENGLIDFGKETFGYIHLNGIKGKGKITLYYGESKEEAMSDKGAVNVDWLSFDRDVSQDSTLPASKAFRYVRMVTSPGIHVDKVSMLYEYADVNEAGSFKCSDDEINRIYEVAKYTFHLNTREFFIDGIKRDRWVWSGDAYQSYLMNYYLYFDKGTVLRTMYALRGKEPVTSHINTIMDYTFYWFLGVYDYYMYTGDRSFIKEIYSRMQPLMDYCLSRRNKDGLMEGQVGDWVFIDWADGLSKKGPLSFEQLLFCRSLETMSLCADIAGNQQDAEKYKHLAADLKEKLFRIYWNEQHGALVHSTINDHVTRYANMFAIFFDYFNAAQQETVRHSVLLNDSIQHITTPYMRFYELEALCALHEQSYVLKEMKNYWGGMLKLGATTFWEEFDPHKSGAAHYAMYGREFGKSLCHAWGASPIYLLGKYYLGVKPTAPGYATYAVEPALGGLQWMEGTVPTPGGNISLHIGLKEMKISTAGGKGTLRFSSSIKPVCKTGNIQQTKDKWYEMTMAPNTTYVINYQSVK